MKTASALAVVFAAAAVSATPSPAEVDARATNVVRSATLPTVTTKGNAFYIGEDRFYIKGIDYQPGGSSGDVGSDGASDPLADLSTCSRDIPYFKQIGVNTIRVYTVDNTANHDDCMNALADAKIYLALDVNTPLYSLNQLQPEKSYNPYYLQSVFATIDAFAGYSNTLLFFSGNEVVNSDNTTAAAPFVKAVTRDIKQYIGERGYRAIPVGYAAADIPQQYTMAEYMNCGSAPSRSDFYAINNYEWCDPSSLTGSGWATLAQQYASYSIPSFMSEYGCITNGRNFEETPALYSTTMTKSFSGGLVYEYCDEAGSKYGVVNLNGNTVSPIQPQFDDLVKEMHAVAPPSGAGGATTNNKPATCPGQSSTWDTSPFTGEALPATPSGAIKYFQNGAGKGPGLKGKGSQWESGGSSATASQSAGAITTTYGSGSSSGAVAAARVNYGSLMICGAALAFSFVFGAAVL